MVAGAKFRNITKDRIEHVALCFVKGLWQYNQEYIERESIELRVPAYKHCVQSNVTDT